MRIFSDRSPVPIWLRLRSASSSWRILDKFFDLGYYIFVPFAILVLISTTNVVNITDGLDGLATGIVIIMMTFFTILAIALGNVAVMIFSAIVTGFNST